MRIISISFWAANYTTIELSSLAKFDLIYSRQAAAVRFEGGYNPQEPCQGQSAVPIQCIECNRYDTRHQFLGAQL